MRSIRTRIQALLATYPLIKYGDVLNNLVIKTTDQFKAGFNNNNNNEDYLYSAQSLKRL